MIPDMSNRTDKLPEFNQGKYKETYYACTIVNAYRSFCYQTERVFREGELFNIVKYAKENM
jgi:hypothetical protein